ncbi:hypothetical protein Scep_025027 [Stephania cephalantha]|uniref:Uncharacterized protein n=1 Tax=Stephania cephalantha TaxID=152367 RepID=A0AAP0F358_9MAGN
MNPGINHPLLEHLVTELYPFGIQPDAVLQKNQIIIFAAHAIHWSDAEDNLLLTLWFIMGSPRILQGKMPPNIMLPRAFKGITPELACEVKMRLAAQGLHPPSKSTV